ncbi:hypothetical protein BVY01_00990, partial [bacterium I07]
PMALANLIRRLKTQNCSERTIRRKLTKLENLELITCLRSTTTIINPIIELADNIKKLSILWNHKDRNY